MFIYLIHKTHLNIRYYNIYTGSQNTFKLLVVKFNPKKLNIAQWNGRSVKANKASLQQYLEVNKINIAILSETWSKPNIPVNFPAYNIVRKDRFDGKAGVAIIISKGINYSELQVTNNFNDEIIVCGVALHNLNVLSMYCPPNATVFSQDWKNLLSQDVAPILIGGDFNAHNSTWDCSRNDNKGAALLNAIDECNLVVLNTGSPTKLNNCLSNSRSAVDISLWSPAIAPQFYFEVRDDTLGSDHFIIDMKYNNWKDETDTIFPSCKFNTKTADWNIFHRTLVNIFQNPIEGSAQKMYSFFLNSVNDAAEASMKIKTQLIPKRKPLPAWWDEECNRAVENRKQKLLKYKHNASLDNFICCQKVCAETKKLLKKKARDSWKSYCSGLNRSTSSSEVWNQIKKYEKHCLYLEVNHITVKSRHKCFIISLLIMWRNIKHR